MSEVYIEMERLGVGIINIDFRVLLDVKSWLVQFAHQVRTALSDIDAVSNNWARNRTVGQKISIIS